MTSTPGRPSHWDQALFIADSESFFERLLTAIAGARHCIDFEYYIFNLDHLGKRFVAALGDAAARGVRVRVMMDGLGSLPHCEAIAEQIAARGVQARVYHPPPWMFGSYRLTRRPHGILLKFFVLLWNINRRDHRKLCTVDRERAWVGSFNISAQHLPQSAGGRAWRDYALELTGPRVESLAEGFDELWEGHTPQLQRGFLAGFLSNRSIKARQIRNRHVARSVASARRRVWLVMAYFLPTAGLRRALLNACREGCDVRLVLPERSDITLFPRLSSHYYRELLRAGAHLYLYQPGVLHAKALLVDDMAIIGSSNWNYRSSLHDLELDVVVRDPATIEQVESAIRGDAADSRELKLSETPVPGPLSWALYGLRYWM